MVKNAPVIEIYRRDPVLAIELKASQEAIVKSISQ